MASTTLSAGGVFPPGTAVGAYPASRWLHHQLPPTGDPIGSAVASGTMGASNLTLTGLEAGERYFAHGEVGSVDRYVTFTAAADESAEGSDASVGRGSTFTVAASDASDLEKAQADYVCDGTADEEEINDAVDDLPTQGGDIVLTSGTFNIASAVLVNRDNVTLRGAGSGIPAGSTGVDPTVPAGATRLAVSSSFTSGYVVRCEHPDLQRCVYGIELRDFGIMGRNYSGGGSNDVGGVYWQVIRGGMTRVFVQYVIGHGLYSTAIRDEDLIDPLIGYPAGAQAPFDSFFTNCRFRNGGGHGMFFDDTSTDHILIGCIVENNDEDGIRLHGDTYASTAIQIHGGYIYSNTGRGITAKTWQLKVYDTRVQDNGTGGLYLTGDAGIGAAFQIVGGSFRNNSVAATNTYDAINIAPTGAIYGGLISGVDFALDTGLDNPDLTKHRYCINVANSNMNDLVIGPCSTSRKGGSAPVWGTAFINDAGTGTKRLSGVGSAVQVLARSAVAASHTGNTTETALATVTVRGGTIGSNGRVRVRGLCTITNSGNNKTVRVRLGGIGGTVFHTATLTTSASNRFEVEIANRNNQAIQVGGQQGATGGWGQSGTAVATGTENTANDKDIVISAQLANSGETITLESYIVELVP